MINLRVNGKQYKLEIDPETPLLWALRDHMGLTGTKYSCGIAECGACTVHVDGEAILSCITAVNQVEDLDIVTIEGLNDKIGQALRKSWIAEDVPECGYCQPGQIMTAAYLLANNPQPTEDDVAEAMTGVLCRCGTYNKIKSAVLRTAQEISG